MSITFLVSPTDDELAAELGDKAVISSLCEQKGADVLIYTKNGLCGVQRKACPHDFAKSVMDGRLAMETTLLPLNCAYSRLVLEGELRYYPDGALVSGVRGVTYRFTRRQIRSILWECEMVKGTLVDYTDDIKDTARYIEDLAQFMDAKDHKGSFRRPACPGEWGKPNEEELQLWILQGFPGIGVGMARSIRSHFGCVPLKWECEYGDLLKIPRMSRNTVKRAWSLLPLSGTPKE